MRIERLNIVSDSALQEKIVCFYEELFAPLNEKTPISQSWPSKDVVAWLEDADVIKFLLWDEKELVGLGMVTQKLELDVLISIPFFKKNYPGLPIYNFPVIAIKDGCRKAGFELISSMIKEGSKNGVGIFFSSNQHNPNIARFASMAMKGSIEIIQVDSEACYISKWRD